MTAATTSANVRRIPIERISPDPDQPRQYFNQDALEDLAESLKVMGLLQPITVRPVGRDYVIVTGERRYRAAQLAGWSEIDCLVRRDLTEVFATQVLENVARADMTPMDEARAYKRLHDEGHDWPEIDKMLGTPRGRAEWVSTLCGLIEPIQQLVDRGHIPAGNAWMIAKLNPDNQRRILRRLSQESIKWNELEGIVSALQAEEAGIEMFPDLEEASPEAKRIAADYADAIERATKAIAALAKLEDRQVVAAIGHKLPGAAAHAKALASETNKLSRRLQKLAAAQAVANEGSAA